SASIACRFDCTPTCIRRSRSGSSSSNGADPPDRHSRFRGNDDGRTNFVELSVVLVTPIGGRTVLTTGCPPQSYDHTPIPCRRWPQKVIPDSAAGARNAVSCVELAPWSIPGENRNPNPVSGVEWPPQPFRLPSPQRNAQRPYVST